MIMMMRSIFQIQFGSVYYLGCKFTSTSYFLYVALLAYNFYDAINLTYFCIHVKNNFFGEIQVVFIVR